MTRKLTTHCKTCKEELTVFNSYYKGIYRNTECISCSNKRSQKSYREAKEKNENFNHERQLKIYNLTKEQYDKLLELQSGGCAICKQECKSEQRLSIDHNHDTNEVRGLLCKSCNAGIGQFKEDEDLLLNAIEYLKRTTWNKKEIA